MEPLLGSIFEFDGQNVSQLEPSVLALCSPLLSPDHKHEPNTDQAMLACSGPGQTNEMELHAGSMDELLTFLEHSFNGGTDLEAPLQLSLNRLEENSWHLVRAHMQARPNCLAGHLLRTEFAHTEFAHMSLIACFSNALWNCRCPSAASKGFLD